MDRGCGLASNRTNHSSVLLCRSHLRIDRTVAESSEKMTCSKPLHAPLVLQIAGRQLLLAAHSLAWFFCGFLMLRKPQSQPDW